MRVSQRFHIRSLLLVGTCAFAATLGTKAFAQVASTSNPTTIESVVVSAQKTEQDIQKVPVPVTVVSTDSLVVNNTPRLQDYYATVQGLNVSPGPSSAGQQMITIRGVTASAFTSPTVGVTMDDIPFGSSVGSFGNLVPDFDPGDLARVEVLRGPQGTLYGASSMGGLIKFVLRDPSTEQFSGRVQLDANGVSNGASMGFGARGSLNIPITETVAMRVSGFVRRTPGYIDNPVLGIKGINEEDAHGAMFSLMWQPSDVFSAKFTALYQDTFSAGANEVNFNVNGYAGVPLGDLQQNYIRGAGDHGTKTQAYGLTLKGKVGAVDLVSVTGFNINQIHHSIDYSYAYNSYSQFYFGVPGATLIVDGRTEKFTQEVRASVPLGEHLDWLVGGFYTHENTKYGYVIPAVNVATGGRVGNLILSSGAGPVYTEGAGFTDLTVHVFDRFDVQLGARQSWNSSGKTPSVSTGAFYGTTPATTPAITSKGDAFTYLVTPTFQITPDHMLYARFASGYRPGGGNLILPSSSPLFNPAVPSTYGPDRTENYEVGAKGKLFDSILSYDLSLYRIDWNDVQISLFDTQEKIGYTANGGKATSEGAEFSLEARPTAGLKVAAWVAYNQAVLAQDFPTSSTVTGKVGNRLPFSPRYSASGSIDQDFPLTEELMGSVGGTISYVGGRLGTFLPGTQTRQAYPAYTKVDLRAGVTYDTWTANLYATNVTDERGQVGGGMGNFPPWAFVLIQPRTVGLLLTKNF